MASVLHMPEVAANAVEAVLQEWVVEENVAFAAEDVIATVETEKAVVDVEAPQAGRILKTLAPAGARITVGAPIAVLGGAEEIVEDLGALLDSLGIVEPAVFASAVRREVSSEPADRAPEHRGAQDATRPDGGRIFSSPLARRLAKEAGFELVDLAGSGPRNRITRRDVEAAITAREAARGGAPAAETVSTAAPVAPAVPEPATATRLPHTPMRRAIASRLTESKQTVPHFYLRATVRVDGLLGLRAELNDGSSAKISINDLVIKAVAQAYRRVPAMNVRWGADSVESLPSVDVAVAVATDGGLLTPVIRSVDTTSVGTIADRVRDVAERARSGSLRQNELEGGSITVTNLGMFGTEEFAAIINPPQAAILAVGAARQEPVVCDGEVVAGTVMRFTLSVDHRPVDGVVAAEWMRAFVSLLEHPVRILA